MMAEVDDRSLRLELVPAVTERMFTESGCLCPQLLFTTLMKADSASELPLIDEADTPGTVC